MTASGNPSGRMYPRAPFASAVRYFDWGEPHVAQASEVSADGIFLRTDAPVAEGRLLTLRLPIPGAGTFTVLARVVRTVQGGLLRPSGMGLHFVDIAASARHAIEALVRGRVVA
jgi:hypothetical protein